MCCDEGDFETIIGTMSTSTVSRYGDSSSKRLRCSILFFLNESYAHQYQDAGAIADGNSTEYSGLSPKSFIGSTVSGDF